MQLPFLELGRLTNLRGLRLEANQLTGRYHLSSVGSHNCDDSNFMTNSKVERFRQTWQASVDWNCLIYQGTIWLERYHRSLAA